MTKIVKTRTTKARECSNSSEAIRGSNLKTSEKMLQDGIESDWVAVALSRSGKNVPIEAKLNYVKSVTEKVEKRINRFSATDLARTIIMMNAMSADPKM